MVLICIGGVATIGWWHRVNSNIVHTNDSRVDGTIVSVSPKVSGRILKVLVNEGDEVKAGQILAKIDPQDIVVQKKRATAALATAKAKYEQSLAGSRPQEIKSYQALLLQANATRDNDYKNYLRLKTLFEKKAISALQLDNGETTYKTSEAAVQVAQEKLDLAIAGTREEVIRGDDAQVKEAEADLQTVSISDDETVIVSPVNGFIAQKNANLGEVVSIGQSLFSVVDCGDLWLNSRIEEKDIGRIKVGQNVEYTIDAYPGRTFAGLVYEIGAATSAKFALIPAENSSGYFTKVTQRVPIKISLPEVDSDIVFRPGMQGDIKVSIK